MLTISFGLLVILLMSRWSLVKGRARNFALLGVMVGVALVPGCGGGVGSTTTPPVTGTPAGTYTVTVTATSGNRSIPTTLTLKVN